MPALGLELVDEGIDRAIDVGLRAASVKGSMRHLVADVPVSQTSTDLVPLPLSVQLDALPTIGHAQPMQAQAASPPQAAGIGAQPSCTMSAASVALMHVVP